MKSQVVNMKQDWKREQELVVKLQNEVHLKDTQLFNLVETNSTQKKLVNGLENELNTMRLHSIVSIKNEKNGNKYGFENGVVN